MIRETEADRVAEAVLIAEVVECWKARGATGAHKLKRSYGLDYALTDDAGKVIAFVEAKDRTERDGNKGYSFRLGNGYWISLGKVHAARQLSDLVHVSCLLVVKFREGERRWFNFALAPHTCIVNGRTDRNDPNDIEPLTVIPWDDFKPLVPVG